MRSRSAKVSSERRAFTLVEVLVAIGIVGVLAGLAIPAIHMAREASRRASCENHQRQIMLAFHSRHDAVGNYYSPEPWHKDCPEFTAGGPFYGAASYLEAGNAVERIDPCFASTLSQIDPSEASLNVFLCPSDGASSEVRLNYRVCFGSTQPAHFSRGNNGAFSYSGRDATAASMTDGLSQTVGVSERLASTDKETYDRRASIWTVAGMPPPIDDEQILEWCSVAPSMPLHFSSFGGLSWASASYEQTFYNHLAPPNWKGADCMVHYGNGGLLAARSAHSGGVVVAMMDGSVRFVSDSVDLSVWRAAATREGREALTLP